jgi:lantibiotic biosynthesis protein
MTDLYECLPWAVLRTPVLPAAWAERAHDSNGALIDPVIVRALAAGCPDLLDTLARPTTRGRDLARARTSLARYLVRMSTRPTPFGAFAAVSLVSWASNPDATAATVSADTGYERLRTRPDMGWLLGLLRDLESDPVARAAATWQANPLAVEHDGRLGVLGEATSVRATRAARHAMDRAREPVPYTQLHADLSLATNGTRHQIDELLTELWRQHLLGTDLRPALTAAHPVERIVALVRRTRPETADALDTLLGELRDLDAAPPSEVPARLTAARKRVADIRPVAEAALQTDLARRLAGQGRITSALGRELARAAELLLSLTPSPSGSNGLIAFRRQFVARYGPDAEVPLLDVLDPAVGIGPIAHDHGPNAPQDQRRTDTLLALALTALRDGCREVELDEPTLAALRTATPAAETAPVSVELSAFVIAHSPADLDAGEFQVVLGPNLGAPSAGRTLGRFADLLEPEASACFAELVAAESRAGAAEPVEVVYLPANARSANVAIRPATTDHEIVLGCASGVADDAVLPWEDLYVAVRGERVIVRSASLDAEIRPTARHMLNAHTAPDICQFLDEVSRGGQATLTGFEWGPAESQPVLPRVRVGRIVLVPARWLFGSAIAGRGRDRAAELPGFAAELAAWRTRWMPPGRVYVTSADNRLLLDLDQPEDVAQLHREAARRPGSALRLEEALPDVDDAWLAGPGGGYVSEVVVPLVRRPVSMRHSTVPPALVRAARPQPGAETARDRTRIPGSDWLFVKLYGPRENENGLLTGVLGDLAEMIDNSGLARQWFFVRYADPEPHLRLRWQGEPDVLLGHVLPQVSDIAAALIARGELRRLVVDTYNRELERYGGPAGTDLCERIFHADSRAVLRLLATPAGTAADLTELAAVSVDALLGGLGLDEAARLAYYAQQAAAGDPSVGRAAGDDYRVRKVRLRQLLDADVGGGASQLDPSGEAAEALAERDAEVRAVAADFVRLSDDGQLAPQRLHPSVVHMHLNRLNGGGFVPPSEALLYHLLERTRRGLVASSRG